MYANSFCSSQNVFGFSSSVFASGGAGVCASAGPAVASTANAPAVIQRLMIVVIHDLL